MAAEGYTIKSELDFLSPSKNIYRSDVLTSLGVALCNPIMHYCYPGGVHIKNVGVLREIMYRGNGALLLPNHIEAADTIALGVKIKEEVGKVPYFVMRPLPFQQILTAVGGIHYERGRDLDRDILKMQVRDDEHGIDRRIHQHRQARSQTFSRINQAILDGDMVTVYLQGTRSSKRKTNITDLKYQAGLRQWLSCLGKNPVSVVPLNISHRYCWTTGSFFPAKKIVEVIVGPPISHTNSLEAITDHLVKNIDSFVDR